MVSRTILDDRQISTLPSKEGAIRTPKRAVLERDVSNVVLLYAPGLVGFDARLVYRAHWIADRRISWRWLAAGAAEIVEWPVWFDDSPSLRLPQLLARARILICPVRMKLRVNLN